jgi:hypothetical protein
MDLLYVNGAKQRGGGYNEEREFLPSNKLPGIFEALFRKCCVTYVCGAGLPLFLIFW